MGLLNYTGAIEDLTKAIAVDHTFNGAFQVRGMAKKELGDLKGACEDWKKAAELGHEDALELLEEHCE